MPTILDKTINGEPVSRTEFRRAICEVLNKFGEEGGRMTDLANAFGPEWDSAEERQRLSVTLVNMANSGILIPIEGKRGYYRTSKAASRERGGVTSYEQTENAIFEVIREAGGVLKMRDIADALAPEGAHRVHYQGNEDRKRDKNGQWRNTDWSRMSAEDRDILRKIGNAYKGFKASLYDVISRSLRIRKASDRAGWYCLDYDALFRMPLEGRSLSTLMSYTGRRLANERMQKGGLNVYEERAREEDWYEELQQPMFAHIGGMIDRLRVLSGDTVEEFIADPRIEKALTDFTTYARHETVSIVSALRDAKGERHYQPPDDEIITEVYSLYAVGAVYVHMKLKTDFVEAVARRYKVDAACLAQGVVVHSGSLK